MFSQSVIVSQETGPLTLVFSQPEFTQETHHYHRHAHIASVACQGSQDPRPKLQIKNPRNLQFIKNIKAFHVSKPSVITHQGRPSQKFPEQYPLQQEAIQEYLDRRNKNFCMFFDYFYPKIIYLKITIHSLSRLIFVKNRIKIIALTH